MSENAPAPVSAPPAPALQPLQPAEGQLVDPVAISFAWDAPADADGGYVLQVAADDAFQDVLAMISTGAATAVTLYDTLRAEQDGTYHWRVRAEGQRGWSPAATFRVLSPETEAARRAEQEAAARARAEAAVRRATADIHRHLDDDNEHAVGSTYTALVIVAIVGSFLLLLLILFLFGQVTYPAEAIA